MQRRFCTSRQLCYSACKIGYDIADFRTFADALAELTAYGQVVVLGSEQAIGAAKARRPGFFATHPKGGVVAAVAAPPGSVAFTGVNMRFWFICCAVLCAALASSPAYAQKFLFQERV
jgi:hypothetical protein